MTVYFQNSGRRLFRYSPTLTWLVSERKSEILLFIFVNLYMLSFFYLQIVQFYTPRNFSQCLHGNVTFVRKGDLNFSESQAKIHVQILVFYNCVAFLTFYCHCVESSSVWYLWWTLLFNSYCFDSLPDLNDIFHKTCFATTHPHIICTTATPIFRLDPLWRERSDYLETQNDNMTVTPHQLFVLTAEANFPHTLAFLTVEVPAQGSSALYVILNVVCVSERDHLVLTARTCIIIHPEICLVL